MRISDWSSDVCSSDLLELPSGVLAGDELPGFAAPKRGVNATIRRGLIRVDGQLIAEHLRGSADLHLQETIHKWREASTKRLNLFSADVERSEIHEPPVGTRSPRKAVRSEEHTSELKSLMRISYAVFCLKKKETHNIK